MTSKSDIESADNIVGFYIALPPFVAVCSYKPDKIDRENTWLKSPVPIFKIIISFRV
jgi:hypothetical protein